MIPLFMYRLPACFVILLFSGLFMASAQAATFDWSTASDAGATVSETVSGVTVTASDANSTVDLVDAGGAFGTGNVAYSATAATSFTLSFSTAIDVTSLHAFDALGHDTSEWTFTPNVGVPVVQTIATGSGETVTLNFTGITSIVITDTNTGNDPFGVDDIVFTLPNNPPTATGVPTDVVAYEELSSPFNLSAVTFTDLDGDSLTVTLAASAGTFAAGSGGGVTIGGSGTGSLTLTGTAANINTYLDTASNIQYTGPTDLSGDNAASYTLNANDGTVNPQVGAGNIDITDVNDAPTLTATGSNPTFTQGGGAASLFSGASAATPESGQTFTSLTLTVTNLNDGANEILNADGTMITLTNGNAGTTATNSLSYSVSVAGSTGTVSFTGGTLSAAAFQTLIDALSYQNNSNNPDTSNRVVTITFIRDNGGIANGGNDTTALGIASTVTVVAAPTITSATYNAALGLLVVTGTNLVNNGGGADIDVSRLTLLGEGGITYPLNNSSDVEIDSPTQFSVTLNATDRNSVEPILNKNGTSANDSTTYSLTATDDWVTAFTTGNTSDGGPNAVTVSNVPVPTITSATYNAGTGVLTVTGTGFVFNNGVNNDVDVSLLTLTGEGGNTYTLTTSDVEITSNTQFSITLNSTDQLSVNGLLNANGLSSNDATTYNLAAAEDWMPGTDSAIVIADLAGNPIMVSGVTAPTITSATFDYTTGSVVVTGTGFVKYPGANNDVDASTLAFTGQLFGTYTLADTSDVEVSSSTNFTLSLSANDLNNVRGLLNANGTIADDGTTYNLAAADNWMPGAAATIDISDATGNGITVSNVVVPTVTSATYNAGTGLLVVTGTALVKISGASNDIDASLFTFTGQGGATYTLTDTADVEIDSATQFTLTLSATDRAATNLLLNQDGTSALDATTYNLAAADNWSPGAASSVDITDATNAVTASNVTPVPTVTDANISISGASGTGGAYIIGDTVTATWDNTAGGDNNAGITTVTVDFSEFGGGAAVSASNSSDTWTATYTITAGVIDTVNRNVSVTASNGAPTTTTDSTNATVDNIAPTVTPACISVTGATGTGGAFKNGDTAVPTWNNTGGCDANGDVASVRFNAANLVAVDTNLAGANAAQTWTATLSGALDAQNDTNNNVTVTAFDDAGNTTTVAGTNNYTINTNLPVISNIVATPTSNSATITWDSGVATSSIVAHAFYGGTSVVGAETDTSPRVTNHSVTLSSLRSCTTYQYNVRGFDAVGNLSVSTDATFTTDGCVGTVDSVLASTGVIANGAPVPFVAGVAGDQVTLTPANNYSGTCDAVFQVANMDESTIIANSGAGPTGNNPARSYSFSAYCDDGTTQLLAFDNPITVEINYADAAVVGLNESSLAIYRWDGSDWNVLPGCVVDTVSNTVTCTTLNFSPFALFGPAAAVVGGGGGGGGTTVGGNTGVLEVCSASGKRMSVYPAPANGVAYTEFKQCQKTKGVFDTSCVSDWKRAMGYQDFNASGQCEVESPAETTPAPMPLESGNQNLQTTTIFSDIESQSLSTRTAIIYLKDAGIVEGYKDGTFRPENLVNRAEALKIAIGNNPPVLETCDNPKTYLDVKPNLWFTPQLKYATCTGLIQGYPDDTFKPEKTMNFLEAAKLAVMFNGFHTLPKPRIGEPWYQVYIEALEEKNAIPESVTSYDQNVTRAEFSYMIWRMMQR